MTIRFSNEGDLPGPHRFNASIVRFRDRIVCAYRTGWAGSEIVAGWLDLPTFRMTDARLLLHLRHRRAGIGREDPRLFVHNDRLHVMYTAFNGDATVLYALLHDDLSVDEVFEPRYDKRQKWEKNWVFFSAGGRLYCIYHSRPYHVVLEVDGERIVNEYTTPNAQPWSGGRIHGGCSPVFDTRTGRFVHFYHGFIETDMRRYNVGFTAFEPKPPFRVLHQSPAPILFADDATRPADQYCSCVFPGGVVETHDSWVMAAGVHDRWAEFFTFPRSITDV